MNENTHSLRRLQELFRELFQLDLADLDFGLYRLLHLRRAEIEAFLAEQLPRQVEEVFASAASGEADGLKARLEELAQQIREQVAEDAIGAAGDIKPEYRTQPVKIVKELVGAYEEVRGKLRAVEITDAHKQEVFNHLYNFFSRYYEDGDFVPHRRYGQRETYAVPYNGEEVFFHWATKDQHYVKTTETFRDYAFRVDGRDLAGGHDYHVRFVLTEASAPKDNTKGDTRYFFPRPDVARFDDDQHTFTLPCEYRLPTPEEMERYGRNSKAQHAILEQALPEILKRAKDPVFRSLLAQDQRSERDQEEGKPELPLLLKRLRHFARRNTSDYFVHKDLRGFLARELEFFVKDQILNVMDLEGDWDAKRRVIRVFRKIAETVIKFLAQVEEVEKRLFEKKKFVLSTEYLIPIMHVPPALRKEVLENKAQLAAWKELFAINPKKDLFNPKGQVNERFLEEHPTLVVHTVHFLEDFTRRLLESLPFDDLDEATDGLLVHAENYQALRLLEARYREQVKCIYIDPPYNTGSDEFIYKDRYQHSSWLAMMETRLAAGCDFLRPDGVLFSSIDKNESPRYRILLGDILGSGNYVGEITWHNARDNNPTRIAIEHEYILGACKDLMRADPIWKNSFADAKELLLAEYERLKQQGLRPAEIEREIRNFIRDNASLLNEVDRYKFVDEEGIYTGSQSVHNPHPGGYDYEILHPDTKKPMRKPATGYRFPEGTMRREYIEKNRLIYGPDENRIIQIKLYLRDYQDSLRSVIQLDGRLGAYALNRLFGGGEQLFDNPKPPELISFCRETRNVPDAPGFLAFFS